MVVGRGKHRPELVRPLPRLEPPIDSALAFVQIPAILFVHSKCPLESALIGVIYLLDAYERRALQVFLILYHACAGTSVVLHR